MSFMRHRYGYEADEPSEWTGFDDTGPLDEPVIDYSIWPPQPPDPEEARDESLRRLGKLTWRAAQVSAVAAAGFAILFVRTAPAPVTTSQKVARPASTLAPTSSPTPSARHPHHRAQARGADDLVPSPAPDAAVAPGSAAPAAPTLTPPTTPPAPSPSPSPAQSTSSGSHSGG
jgi:hypothetical protein